MKIIAIDPGIMTGYCFATLEDGHLTYVPYQNVDDVDVLWAWLTEFEPRFIIIEDFEFRRGKGGVELFPVQLIGVARLYSEIAEHDCGCFKQKASTGKQYYTNPALKQLGLFKRGAAWEHAMDASRHLLQWCMFGYGNQFIGKQSAKEFATMVDDLGFWREKHG